MCCLCRPSIESVLDLPVKDEIAAVEDVEVKEGERARMGYDTRIFGRVNSLQFRFGA